MAHHHENILPSGADGGNRRLNRSFKIGIWLNVFYVVVEMVYGLIYNSMGLISDAGHNLSDVASMLIALFAYKVAMRKPNDRFTYGYRKATVDASVVNALILYVAVALILTESIRKLMHPEQVNGNVIAWVAGIGVIVNGLTTWLFVKDSKCDLNVKGVFLHMAADTLVSVGVVISGIVIHFTGWNIIDPIIGIGIAVMIAIGSYSMLKDSLRMALDGVPEDIDINKIREAILAVPGVSSIHHLHIWPISTTLTAMTVHVVIENRDELDSVIQGVRKAVEPLGIGHSTIEVETSCDDCKEEASGI